MFGKLILLCLSCALWLGITSCSAIRAIATDVPAQNNYAPYFSSWTSGEDGETNPTVQTIMDFVAEVKDAGIEPEDRIAVFDNDGTIWSEYPLIPGEFVKQHGPAKGETTDAYIAAAEEFLNGTDNENGYPYLDRIYKPMVELLEYLQDNGFQTYICSGGDTDFIRAFAEGSYHIPPEKVIGSLVPLKFHDNDPSVLVRGSILGDDFFFNDSENKPVGIERYIGKRPIMAVGNSNGDWQMLEYADDEQGPALMMLVRHDDLEREDYEETDTSVDCSVNEDDDPLNNLGTGTYCHANDALAEAANEDDWYLISVKNDFDKVFMGESLD